MDDDTAALLAGILPGTLIERLGIEVAELSPEGAVGSMPVEGNRQTHGLLHGGASAALAETLGSLAASAHAHPGVSVGVDLNITHHRAAREGRVTGVATRLSGGKTVATYGVEIRDDGGALVATARLTCVIRPAVPGGVG